MGVSCLELVPSTITPVFLHGLMAFALILTENVLSVASAEKVMEYLHTHSASSVFVVPTSLSGPPSHAMSLLPMAH